MTPTATTSRREAIRQREIFRAAGVQIVENGKPNGTKRPPQTGGPSARVAEFLVTTTVTRLTWPELFKACVIHSLAQTRVRHSRTVEAAMHVRGWSSVPRKTVGVRGNGSVLVRHTN